MVHIKKAKGKGYFVSITADNGEILCTSEVLNTKYSCYKNIAASAKQLSNTGGVIVTDETTGQKHLVTKLGKKFPIE